MDSALPQAAAEAGCHAPRGEHDGLGFAFAPVVEQDFEPMLALRIAALRDSLERLGRFDPQRARERLAAQFQPQRMRHILRDGQRIGFMTVVPAADSLCIQHLYIQPGEQGRGAGAWALAQAKMQARAAGQDLTLSALQRSDANRFYLRHGFVSVGQSDFDTDYRWQHARAEAPC